MYVNLYHPLISGAIIDSLRSIQRDIDKKNGDIKMKEVQTNGSVAEALPEEEEGAVEEADLPQFVWFCKGKYRDNNFDYNYNFYHKGFNTF